MKKAIIIPIYLNFNQPEELPQLEGLKLAKRAIKSLRVLRDQAFTLILPVCFDLPEREGDSLSELDPILQNEVRDLGIEKILIFSSSHLRALRECLNQKNFRDFNLLIDLNGFPKIRNTGLLLAQALSMDMVIFMDSDEVLEDPNYLKTASEYLDERWKGKLVSGKGGFYLNPDGSIFLSPRGLWWDILWDKIRWMNQTYERILHTADRLVCSPMLLGGNLVLHQRLFQRIPFDPYIPRGEDTDYLINASHFGFCIFFDKELRVKHLHPERTETYFDQELKGDIERFLYERQKIKGGLGFHLDPYPGYFLRWSLYPKALLTSLSLSLDYLAKRQWTQAKKCIANMGFLLREKRKGWVDYLRFKRDWERVMGIVQKEGIDEILKNGWV